MRSHWTIAALLGSALLVACNGRGSENAQNSDQNQAAAPVGTPAVTGQTAAPAPPARPQQRRTAADKSPILTGKPPATVQAPQWREISVPAGTVLPLELTTALSSETAQVETPVSARIRNPVVINGDTVLPAGATVAGTVTDVARAGRVEGRAHLSFAFNELRVNSGREDIRTNPVTVEGEATKGEDATTIGAGAGVGAIIGGILGGKKGAGKGAVVGGAAGTGVVLATRGKDVTLAEGTNVTATLAQPLTIRVPIH